MLLTLLEAPLPVSALIFDLTHYPNHSVLLQTVGSDYDAISEALTFQPGASPGVNDTECFYFLPTDDMLIEDIEDINLNATSADPHPLFAHGDNTAIIYIHDDG